MHKFYNLVVLDQKVTVLMVLKLKNIKIFYVNYEAKFLWNVWCLVTMIVYVKYKTRYEKRVYDEKPHENDDKKML